MLLRTQPSPSAPPRIALYSHDTQGLGHLRRNLRIAAALADSPAKPQILLLTGACTAAAFALPDGVEVVSLPSLHKNSQGAYSAERLAMPLQEITRIRESVIRAAVTAFAPDLFVVDKAARGAFGELDSTLSELRRRGDTTTVLGLRDVLDDPLVARREWAREQTTGAISAMYDQVWVYGDRRVYDPVLAYDLPESVARKITYTGYLGAQMTDEGQPSDYVLCLVGGGQDGYALASAFIRSQLPEGCNGRVLCGPYMPTEQRQALERAAAGNDRMEVIGFLDEPTALIASARAVVGMAGYNTSVEVLAAKVPALLVPRVQPREEQLVRAARLAELGLVDHIHPAAATPTAITTWMADAVHRRGRRATSIDLNGLDRIRGLVTDLLTEPKERIDVR